MSNYPRVAVLLASYNRKAKTVECIRRVTLQAKDLAEVTVFLFDDGSTDGTASAVAAAFPATVILRGDGSYFWNRSMKVVFDEALSRGGYDEYLWLNDDTYLIDGALEALLASASRVAKQLGPAAIIVGATRDPDTGKMTYGGGKRVSPIWRPFRANACMPNGTDQLIGDMNGNIVLVSSAAASRLGSLDPVFQHAMGDTEYALRAARKGVPVVLAPTYIGTCSRNAVSGSYLDPKLGFMARMKAAFSRKGMPARSWWHMCRLYGGPLWLVHFAWCYVRIAMGRR